jgi:hypothetical protein
MVAFGGRNRGCAMQIQQSSQHGMTVLTLAGRLDLAAAPQLQRAILKHLAHHPPAMVCDLAEVEAMDPLCAGGVHRHPASRPGLAEYGPGAVRPGRRWPTSSAAR